jgi:hypothetical protein
MTSLPEVPKKVCFSGIGGVEAGGVEADPVVGSE